jgi:hypothetical protein
MKTKGIQVFSTIDLYLFNGNGRTRSKKKKMNPVCAPETLAKNHVRHYREEILNLGVTNSNDLDKILTKFLLVNQISVVIMCFILNIML